LHAARALAGANAQVTLLDRHNYHLFQPLLYQVATASLSPGDVASPIRWILRHQKNVEVLLAEAQSIDPVGRQVIVEDGGSVPYDYLVLATGAAHAYFGHPEWARRALAQDARRCAGDAAAGAAGVRGAEREADPTGSAVC
jgi:NADH dehydrogenase